MATNTKLSLLECSQSSGRLRRVEYHRSYDLAHLITVAIKKAVELNSVCCFDGSHCLTIFCFKYAA
ncbi:hypothetical protein [Nostoc sp. UHCC 0870]|uniref:hypothetical protein n=1 Tax=Nostoc sp. UHCC 0870 TaxID=2914041 RepID=UPI0030D72F39